MKKNQKRLVITILTLTAITAAGIGFATASGHGFHRGMPPVMKEEIREFIIWKVNKDLSALDLSETQQAASDQFRQGLDQILQTGMESRGLFREQVRQELAKDEPDLSGIISDLQHHIDRMSGQIIDNLGQFSVFYQSLDAKQKQTVAESLKKKLARHHGCFMTRAPGGEQG